MFIVIYSVIIIGCCCCKIISIFIFIDIMILPIIYLIFWVIKFYLIFPTLFIINYPIIIIIIIIYYIYSIYLFYTT